MNKTVYGTYTLVNVVANSQESKFSVRFQVEKLNERWVKLDNKMSHKQAKAFAAECVQKMNEVVYGAYRLGVVEADECRFKVFFILEKSKAKLVRVV